LLTVLLTLVLRHASEQVLDKDAVGVFAEFDGRGLKRPARPVDFGAKLKVSLKATCEAADIVDDHDDLIPPVLAHESEHVVHAGTPE